MAKKNSSSHSVLITAFSSRKFEAGRCHLLSGTRVVLLELQLC